MARSGLAGKTADYAFGSNPPYGLQASIISRVTSIFSISYKVIYCAIFATSIGKRCDVWQGKISQPHASRSGLDTF
jgi:hypothetical protein